MTIKRVFDNNIDIDLLSGISLNITKVSVLKGDIETGGKIDLIGHIDYKVRAVNIHASVIFHQIGSQSVSVKRAYRVDLDDPILLEKSPMYPDPAEVISDYILKESFSSITYKYGKDVIDRIEKEIEFEIKGY